MADCKYVCLLLPQSTSTAQLGGRPPALVGTGRSCCCHICMRVQLHAHTCILHLRSRLRCSMQCWCASARSTAVPGHHLHRPESHHLPAWASRLLLCDDLGATCKLQQFLPSSNNLRATPRAHPPAWPSLPALPRCCRLHQRCHRSGQWFAAAAGLPAPPSWTAVLRQPPAIKGFVPRWGHAAVWM